MPLTPTTRLLLRKPDPDPSTGDLINVSLDLNGNWDKIDGAIGKTICTSGTRPTGVDRWDGREIYETDTRRSYMWSAALTTWLPLLVGRGTDGPYLLGQSTDTSGEGINSRGSVAAAEMWRSRVTTDANPRYTVRADGRLDWGPGTAAVDTNLYRNAANELKTDDTLSVVGDLNLTGNLNVTGSAPYKKLAENILGSAASSVTFSSIPGTYRHLKLLIRCRGDTAAAFTSSRIRFNSDTGATYDSQQDSSVGSTSSGFEGLNQTGLDIGEASANTAVAGSCSDHDVSILWYANTTFWKTALTLHMLQAQTSGGAANGLHSKNWAGRWRSTAAITSITIFPAAGNFVTGSSFSLHGML